MSVSRVLGKAKGPDRLKDITGAHVGRHTAASLALHRAGSPVHVQSLLGHSSLSVTMIYSHLVRDKQNEKRDLQSSFDAGDGCSWA